MSVLVINTDGGARNNPGPSGIGVVITRDGTTIATLSEYIGEQTNNWAEYQAVIRALEEVRDRGLTTESLLFKLDSKLVAEQLMGNWKIKEPTLKPQAARAQDLMRLFPSVVFQYVPREENKEADKLVNEAVDRALGA